MTLSEALAYYNEKNPRGEYVLVLEGAKEAVREQPSQEDALAQVLTLRSQGLSLKDAVKQVSKALGLPKNALYDAALQAEE
jgi:16S rRNA (cytidine1402-2'-O)-methyltransferase